LDEEVAAEGGRLYLAKDSRQSREIFNRNYKIKEWNNSRRGLDPSSLIASDLASRLDTHG
jgi:decaprenylphospho-beta-D-ribofuranose 2-oxidase